MSGRPIDHIVLAVSDLSAAAGDYQRLGFTLTPRAYHEDRMGTSNQLLQFRDRNFIELLEVDRPHTLDEHAFDPSPPRFSFGAHNRDFLAHRNGVSMIVFASDDARADIAAFRASGLQTYAPFDFERQAKMPDGSQVTVGFSLGFVTNQAMSETAFFVCQQHAPQHFWKPQFQRHRNGALGIATVYISASDPDVHEQFFGQLFGGEISAVESGFTVCCGEHQQIAVLEPARIEQIAPDTLVNLKSGPAVAGVALRCDDASTQLIPSSAGCGMFVEWVQ